MFFTSTLNKITAREFEYCSPASLEILEVDFPKYYHEKEGSWTKGKRNNLL